MIPALTLTNIVFTYPGTSEPLLDGIDVTFARGWTAVLGDNGIGKTTAGQARDRPALARCRAHIADSEPPAYRLLPAEHRRNTGESGGLRLRLVTASHGDTP